MKNINISSLVTRFFQTYKKYSNFSYMFNSKLLKSKSPLTIPNFIIVYNKYPGVNITYSLFFYSEDRDDNSPETFVPVYQHTRRPISGTLNIGTNLHSE